MSAASTPTAIDRLARRQIGVAIAIALGIAGILVHDVVRSPKVPFLLEGTAPWILAQTPLQTHGMEIDRAHPPMSFFEGRFSGDGHGERVTLQVRALSEVALLLNGEPLPLAIDPARWKDTTTLDVTARILPGENRLTARVINPVGNPALSLRVDGLAEPFVTDTQWLAAWEGDPVAYAALAEDSVRHPEREIFPEVFASLRAKALPLALFAAIGAALFALLVRSHRAARWAPFAAILLVGVFWLLLFREIVRLPPGIGFDAEAHIAYVEWLLAHRALPPPSAGTEMYHPPLFHALAALLLAKLRPLGIDDHVALSLLPLAAGFGMAWVARAMVRRLMPGEPWLEAAAIATTGLLPMSLTVASCISNEGPHAWIASLALLVAVRAMVRERASTRDDLVLGALLGVALLTKYSSVILAPVLLGAVAAKRLVAERAPIAKAALRVAMSAGCIAGLAGWLYLRNYRLSGDPLVWNLDASPDKSWWQLPGFHTAAYYTRFGESLVRPWFSSFYSYWDSLYSTFWGDGLLSGASSPGAAVHRWSYEWMATCFALAVPATLLLATGWIEAARRSLRGAAGARTAFLLLFLLPPIQLGTLGHGILTYPFWSGPKAFYFLSLAPTFGLFVALGFAQLEALLARAPLAIRALPFAWAAAFAGAIGCSYLG